MTKVFVISIILVFAIGFTSSAEAEPEPTHLSKSRNRPENRKKKLLIDTDPGADDVVAIIMALKNERLNNGPKVIGITCVNGNTGVNGVVMNVLKTLKAVDRLNVPVYQGASHPLLLADKKDYYFGQDGFGDFNYPDPPSRELIKKDHAVLAMIELIQKNPGEITLVTLGPLTNIALAIRLYPEFLENLHELVILGGSTESIGNVEPSIEFNFFADPIANYIVFSSATSKPVTLVSWEAAKRANVTMKFRQDLGRSENPETWLMNSAESVGMKPKDEYWICADCIAMTVALTPKSTVTKSQTYHSDAIYDGTRTAGMIIVDYTNITGGPVNTNLIQEIDVEVYENLLLDTFSD